MVDADTRNMHVLDVQYNYQVMLHYGQHFDVIDVTDVWQTALECY